MERPLHPRPRSGDMEAKGQASGTEVYEMGEMNASQAHVTNGGQEGGEKYGALPTSSPRVDTSVVIKDVEATQVDAMIQEYVPANKRPRHRLGFKGLWGKKVDTIEWCKVRACGYVREGIQLERFFDRMRSRV